MRLPASLSSLPFAASSCPACQAHRPRVKTFSGRLQRGAIGHAHARMRPRAPARPRTYWSSRAVGAWHFRLVAVCAGGRVRIGARAMPGASRDTPPAPLHGRARMLKRDHVRACSCRALSWAALDQGPAHTCGYQGPWENNFLVFLCVSFTSKVNTRRRARHRDWHRDQGPGRRRRGGPWTVTVFTSIRRDVVEESVYY